MNNRIKVSVDRKKLLFLVPMCPLPIASGTQARVVGLVRRLARTFDVTLLTLVPEPSAISQLDALRPFCARIIPVVPDNKRSVLHRVAFKLGFWFRHAVLADSPDRFYTMMPAVKRALRRELEEHSHDVLLSSYWYWTPWLSGARGLKVVDTNDVQWERYASAMSRSHLNTVQRLHSSYALERWRRWEIDALQHADVVVTTTEHDRDVLVAQGHVQVTPRVVPTGVDTEHFVPRPERAEPEHIAFYGALKNPVNEDAVVYLLEEILPRIRKHFPGVRLTIVGSFPSTRVRALVDGRDRIVVTHYVEDVREPLSRAWAVVLPLRYAQGIRGRVFELFGMAVPIVATSAAVRGMGLGSGDGLLLADDPEAFAAAVARILSDPRLRNDLGQRGRELAVSRYSLAATYDPCIEFLGECLQRSRAAISEQRQS